MGHLSTVSNDSPLAQRGVVSHHSCAPKHDVVLPARPFILSLTGMLVRELSKRHNALCAPQLHRLLPLCHAPVHESGTIIGVALSHAASRESEASARLYVSSSCERDMV